MTRIPRDNAGKPIPVPRRQPDEWFEESTTKTRIPTIKELEAELRQHAQDGQGDDFNYRRPL